MSMKDDVKTEVYFGSLEEVAQKLSCVPYMEQHSMMIRLAIKRLRMSLPVPEESKEAQPDSVKESEVVLPPLDITIEEKQQVLDTVRSDEGRFWAPRLMCRERQLLAQISKTNAAEAELTSLRGAGWVSVKAVVAVIEQYTPDRRPEYEEIVRQCDFIKRAVRELVSPSHDDSEPCKFLYSGGAQCGYKRNECMHNGSPSATVPPLGRHEYQPPDAAKEGK